MYSHSLVYISLHRIEQVFLKLKLPNIELVFKHVKITY